MTTDLDAARTALRRTPVAPFHAWSLGRPTAAAIREADNDLQNGWVRHADRQVIELAAPYPWEGRGTPAVAVEEMQSWAMLDPLLVAHAATGSWAYLEVATELAEDWAGHGAQAGGAWKGAAPAGRAHRLAYLVHATAIEDAIDMQRWRRLARLAERHAGRLQDGAGSGIDALLSTLARRSLLLRLGEHLDVGADPDLHSALAGCLDERGIVASPSTSDHITVATALSALDADDEAVDLTAVRRRVEDGLAWLITTDGHPANFGVTALEPVNGLWRGGDLAVHEVVAPLVSDALVFALSAGQEGLPPTVATRVLRGADLMVVKPVWTTYGEPGAYAAIDRRTGSLVWHDQRRPIVVAPGTTAAALEGASSDRLKRGAEWLDAVVPNGVTLDPPPVVVGHSARVGMINDATFFDISWDHEDGAARRTVVVDPGHWLFVIDWIDSETPRAATQSFLLAPGLDAIDHDGGYLISTQGTPVAWAMSLDDGCERVGVRTGGGAGDQDGWWAPRPGRIAPATHLGWTTTAGSSPMATVLSLAGPTRAVPQDDESSFGFAIDGRTVRLDLGPKGLVDMQELP